MSLELCYFAAGQRGKSTFIAILSCIQYKYFIKICHFWTLYTMTKKIKLLKNYSTKNLKKKKREKEKKRKRKREKRFDHEGSPVFLVASFCWVFRCHSITQYYTVLYSITQYCLKCNQFNSAINFLLYLVL